MNVACLPCYCASVSHLVAAVLVLASMPLWDIVVLASKQDCATISTVMSKMGKPDLDPETSMGGNSSPCKPLVVALVVEIAVTALSVAEALTVVVVIMVTIAAPDVDTVVIVVVGFVVIDVDIVAVVPDIVMDTSEVVAIDVEVTVGRVPSMDRLWTEME